MRIAVAGPVKARRGQTVRFRVKMIEGMTYAYCQVFSAVGEFDPSPHVPEYKISGKNMVSPVSLIARDGRRRVEIELVADEDCRFWIMQDVDVKSDPVVKARIWRDDPIGNFFARAFGWVRGDL